MDGAGSGVPRLRLVTANSGGLGTPPAGYYGPAARLLAERPGNTKSRSRKRGPGDRNRHGGAPRGARPRSQGDAGRLASASACRVMARQGCLASTPRRLGAPVPVIRGMRTSLPPRKRGRYAAPARDASAGGETLAV